MTEWLLFALNEARCNYATVSKFTVDCTANCQSIMCVCSLAVATVDSQMLPNLSDKHLNAVFMSQEKYQDHSSCELQT